MSKMPDIEMTYFPIHGFRGLMPRLVMHLGDIPFTEKIIQMQDWATVKPSKYFMKAPSNITDNCSNTAGIFTRSQNRRCDLCSDDSNFELSSKG